MRLTPHPNFSHDGAASASETDHDDAGAEVPLALAASDAVLLLNRIRRMLWLLSWSWRSGSASA